MFSGELVGLVDPEVAAMAEGGLVRGAEEGGFFFAADVALHLHLKWVAPDSSELGSGTKMDEEDEHMHLQKRSSGDLTYTI